MNSICELCSLGINEGSVCRECRVNFSSLSINVHNYNKCLKCEYCDIHEFPCLQCAQYVFNGVLGRGNGEWDEMSEEGYDNDNINDNINMDVEDMVRILRDKKNIIVEGFESSEINKYCEEGCAEINKFCEEISAEGCSEINKYCEEGEKINKYCEEECDEINKYCEKISTEIFYEISSEGCSSEETFSEISSEETFSEISSEECSEISEETYTKKLYKLKSLINQAEDSINRKEAIIKLKKAIISENKEDAATALEYIRGKYEASENSELSDSYSEEMKHTDVSNSPAHIISKPVPPKKKGYYSWVKGGVKKVLFM